MMNESKTETIHLSNYGFEWYKGDKLVKEGLIENLEETIEGLKEEGYYLVD